MRLRAGAGVVLAVAGFMAAMPLAQAQGLPSPPSLDPTLHAAWQGCISATAYSKQALDDCTSLLEHRLALRQMRFQALTVRANLLELNGQSEAALADVTAALELQPYHPELFYFRGTLHDRLFRYNEALADFDQVVRLNPNMVRGHGWRALTLQRFGRHAEALSELNIALSMLPEEDHYYAMRGLSQAALGRREQAAKDYEEALKRNPDQWKALDGRARLLFERRAFAEALRDLDRLIGLRPGNADFVGRRASVLFWQGRLDQALSGHTEAIRLQPENAAYYIDRCATRLGLHQLDQAEADCEKARTLAPSWDFDLYDGLFLLKRGRTADAVAAFERSITRSPGTSVALYGRGVGRKRLGDAAGGEADMAAARKMLDLVDHGWMLLGQTP